MNRASITITDAHVHIWNRDSPERPWDPGGRRFAHGPEATAESVLESMDDAGVDRAVLIPPVLEGFRNTTCLEAGHRYPDRFAVMGRISPNDPAQADRVVAWRDQPHMLGIRLICHTPETAAFLAGEDGAWLWAAAQEGDIPVFLYAPGQSERVAEIARRHPSLRLAIDHMGLPAALRDHELEPGVSRLLTLADLPNVAVKISCLPSFSSGSYPFRQVWDPVLRLLEAFGPQRTFWGSDLTRLPCTYAESVTMVTDEMGFSGDELEWIMGRALSEWIGWPTS